MNFNARILPLVIASALFMEQMDSTIIATSLPDIAADLGTNPISLKLAFTTYLLGLTVMLPVSGWLADRFGSLHIFRLAIVIFTAASFACGFADSLGWLVVCRGLQGVGGALMVPVGRIIILRSVEKSKLLDALAWLTIPALIGPVVGPPIGGFITTVYDWRWIFWMNLPFGLASFGLATWLMPNYKLEHLPPLDVKGFLLAGGGLTLAVLGLTIAGRGLLANGQVLTMVLAGLFLLAAYVVHARRAAAPLLDLRMLRIDTYRLTVIGGSLFRIAVGATPFLLPLMLQLGFGYSALDAGLVTFASAIGAIIMKFTVARIVRHFGFRQLLIVNGSLACISIAAMGLFGPQTPYLVMAGTLLFAGLFRSLQFSSLNTIAYADVDVKDMAKANGLYTVLQQLTLAFGVAVAALLLDFSLWWRQSDVLVTSDFQFAIIVVAAISLVSVWSYWRLADDAGASVSGKDYE